ncbi:hypothetical protein OR571_03435 [Psychrobacillus sp. NEAU-3TGS]|uniref:hypothetical protein n=1 Tax=Psychrobacillus sp. NEAU-3TGS TaxID=2995412 RepID=UPI0024982F7B|nr:hypothetical protein [Psychrobacillus sp. NEAU-3TGS]MDI2586202.1 hypothetical protein [Psychrobacillus sp. NEAU-3TGS]
MKQFILLILIVCGILTGCGGNKVTISEINLEKTNDIVKNFIMDVENDEKGTGSGIYMYNDSKKRYLYLNQNFLDDGKEFGDIDIKTDKNSINIYLNDISNSEGEVGTYKLYKINVKGDYEYLKVFKNGEETHFEGIGT